MRQETDLWIITAFSEYVKREERICEQEESAIVQETQVISQFMKIAEVGWTESDPLSENLDKYDMMSQNM